MYIKRIFAVICINIVGFTLFSSSSDESGASDIRSTSYNVIIEKPIEFTIFSIFNNMPFNAEWPVFKRAAELTNVSLKGVTSQRSYNEVSSFNLILSAGNLPDVIGYSQPFKLDALGRNGVLIPLNNLIKLYAPDIQKLLDDNPDYKAEATALDGNIYFIPKFTEVEVAMGYFIRTDWLKKLNLKTPQNLDELYTVLKAFREQDPNGNGIKDEIPMFKRNVNSNIWDLFGIWGASTGFDLKNSKIVYGPMEEEFKYAMSSLIKWYREGLIDPEIFTRGTGARDILLGQNIGGFTHDWFGSTANYNRLADKIDGFEFKPMPPVINQNGERLEKSTRHHFPGWGISTACKDPVTLMKYFNFFFTPSGHKLINFGIEGETYNMVDGEPVYTDKIMKSDNTPLKNLRSYGVQYRIGMLQDFAYEKAWLNDIAVEGMQMYLDGGYIERGIPSNYNGLMLKYTPEQDKEYIKIMSQINDYTLEMIQRWMLVGNSDFEKEYPSYIKSLEQKGIKRAIEINQVAYNIYKNKIIP